ncbi:MAG: HAD-IIB family hydrolase [Gammaproteobacteria bacterium]|nr:HAD-IIB family hydrolase [Gammaproteobacteria bacterium]
MHPDPQLLPASLPARVRFLLTDVDGTLTSDGMLEAETYEALHALSDAGIQVVPVTGGCAGWADMMARTWPVAGVIAEGGALYIRRLADGRVHYRFWDDRERQRADQREVLAIVRRLLPEHPGLALAMDQDYRLCDVAIDHAQQVRDVPQAHIEAQIEAVLQRLGEAGLQATRSSIHVNVWRGRHAKGAMARRLLGDEFGLDGESVQARCICLGDSPNDQDLFAHFELSVGVANIRPHWTRLRHRPRWVTNGAEGAGFRELARCLLSAPGNAD